MRFFVPLLGLLALSACTFSSHAYQPLDNPLYSAAYYGDLTERMMGIAIRQDPLLEDDAMADAVDSNRRNALAKTQEARDAIRNGRYGQFVEVSEAVQGEALLLDGVFHVGPTFDAVAGADLHLYLTDAVDPRDVRFPDPSSIDLGPIVNAYGHMSYHVPETEQLFRTAVIWDASLQRMHGFAQLSQQN